MKWKKERLKVIVFDLDDTLFDTLKQLVEPAVKESCLAMIAAGLDTELSQCIETRKQIFLADPRVDIFKKLIDFFPQKEGADPQMIYRSGYNAFYGRKVKEEIQPFPETRDLLESLKGKYELYLVTSGTPATQKQKVEKLKIGHYFQHAYYVDPLAGENKKQYFLEILKRTKLEPYEVLCIGDRPDREIRDARDVGLWTCRVRQGEYRHLSAGSEIEQAHLEVDGLGELLKGQLL